VTALAATPAGAQVIIIPGPGMYPQQRYPQQGPTGPTGKMVTTNLIPKAPAQQGQPLKPAPNPPPVEPTPLKLQGVKWQGGSQFEDSQGRQWRRIGGLPFFPLPMALDGWVLPINDGQQCFYTNNGQLYILVPPQPKQ
jgi:hypothetical protein